MNTKILLLVAVVAFAPLAGCVPSKTGVDINYGGEINSSIDGFHMNGELVARGSVPETDGFQSVSVVLYSDDGEQLATRTLGNLSEFDGRLSVSLNTTVIPKYVVFDSPDFWKGQTRVTYFVMENGRYNSKRATSRAELPVS